MDRMTDAEISLKEAFCYEGHGRERLEKMQLSKQQGQNLFSCATKLQLQIQNILEM